MLDLGRDEAAKIFTRFDADRVFAAARAADRRRAAGETLPLHGVRVSIKDLFDEAGEVTSAGSVVLRDASPAAGRCHRRGAPLAAGAVPFGRTTMSEFAYSGVGLNPHTGTPGNVRDGSRIPGGSTSGGGVSVGLGLCDAALGSDTGGSIRIPAAFNGLAGFKPSQGTVPLAGGFPLAGATTASAPSHPASGSARPSMPCWPESLRPEGRHRAVAGLKIGVVRTLLADDLDDRVGADYGQALAALSRAGADLRDVAVPCFEQAGPANRVIVASEAHAVHAHHLDRLDIAGDPRVLRRIRSGGAVTPEERRDALASRAAARVAFAGIARGFDVLIAPTLPLVAPTIAAVEKDFDRLNALVLRNPSVVNFVDGCAATLPMSAPDGLATGLMLMGPNGTDDEILAIATAIEALIAR